MQLHFVAALSALCLVVASVTTRADVDTLDARVDALAQNPVPPPPLPPPDGESQGNLLDVEGHPLVPGALPAGTPAAAREQWERVCRASFMSAGVKTPVTAFELRLDVRFKAKVQSSNDFKATYSFLAPGFVRATLQSGREILRGPEGDFLLDKKRGEPVKLDATRENAEDRRLLDEILSISRNFVALTDPRSLRIAGLMPLAAAPAALPEKFKARANELAWIDVQSPDFRLSRARKGKAVSGTPICRVQLGIDPKADLVELALVNDGTSKAALAASTLLIEMKEFETRDDFKVPRSILVYEIDETQRTLTFRSEPTSDMVVMSANLRAALKAEDFLPRDR